MKAIALFSGGLDSILAIKIIQEQGIDIVAININIGFESKYDKKNELAKICKNIGVEFLQIDIREQYLNEILFSPKYGYGKYFNPCIDCHANMFRIAKNLLDEVGASFLISGEVVGQRPMSQNKDALNSVSNLGNIEGLLVRPLSAKLLKPTIPEINGWIDRNKLLSISGRSRTQQIEIAKKYTDKIYFHERVGYADPARQFAVELASNNWIFVIDADEIVTKPLRDKIIEIGALKLAEDNIVGIFQTLINPEREIPLLSTKITGITNEMVKNAPTYKKAFPDEV